MSGEYLDQPHWVYVFRNRHDEVLYVGRTIDLPERLRAHRCDKDWYGEVAQVEAVLHPDYATATAAELLAIDAHRPLYERSPRGRHRREAGVA